MMEAGYSLVHAGNGRPQAAARSAVTCAPAAVRRAAPPPAGSTFASTTPSHIAAWALWRVFYFFVDACGRPCGATGRLPPGRWRHRGSGFDVRRRRGPVVALTEDRARAGGALRSGIVALGSSWRFTLRPAGKPVSGHGIMLFGTVRSGSVFGFRFFSRALAEP